MSSAECLAKIQEYQRVRAAIGGLGSGIDSCGKGVSGDDGTGGANSYVSKIVVSGKAIDDGKLATIAADINGIPGMLAPVVAECDEKILEWRVLYKQALAREEEEAKRRKNVK